MRTQQEILDREKKQAQLGNDLILAFSPLLVGLFALLVLFTFR